MLRRALVASTVGTAIDAYGFLPYGTAGGLVFGRLFFSDTGPATGLLASGTYAVGFRSRRLGACQFGHYGRDQVRSLRQPVSVPGTIGQ
jgi:hypothetical protein